MCVCVCVLCAVHGCELNGVPSRRPPGVCEYACTHSLEVASGGGGGCY